MQAPILAESRPVFLFLHLDGELKATDVSCKLAGVVQLTKLWGFLPGHLWMAELPVLLKPLAFWRISWIGVLQSRTCKRHMKKQWMASTNRYMFLVWFLHKTFLVLQLTNLSGRVTDPQCLIWTFFFNCEGNRCLFNLRKLEEKKRLKAGGEKYERLVVQTYYHLIQYIWKTWELKAAYQYTKSLLKIKKTCLCLYVLHPLWM